MRYKLALLLEPHGVRHCNGTSMLDQEPRTELPESHLHLLRAPCLLKTILTWGLARAHVESNGAPCGPK